MDRYPSVDRIRAIREAVDGLTDLTVDPPDEFRAAVARKEPWAITRAFEIRLQLSEVNSQLSGRREERARLKPKPMGTRGWPGVVNSALMRIDLIAARLTSRWGLHQDPGFDGSKMIAPVLEERDFDALFDELYHLDQALRGVGALGSRASQARPRAHLDEAIPEGYFLCSGTQLKRAFPDVSNRYKFIMARDARDLGYLKDYKKLRKEQLVVLPANETHRETLLKTIEQTRKNRKMGAKRGRDKGRT